MKVIQCDIDGVQIGKYKLNDHDWIISVEAGPLVFTFLLHDKDTLRERVLRMEEAMLCLDSFSQQIKYAVEGAFEELL